MEVRIKKLQKGRLRDFDKPRRSNAITDINWWNAPDGHVVSGVDEKPKFSHGYQDCIGVAATGVCKTTGKKLSLLTHQSPHVVKYGLPGRHFKGDLTVGLRELTGRSKPGTVEVGIFGGQKDRRTLVGHEERTEGRREIDINPYPRQAAQVHEVVKKVTGKKARVVAPPVDFRNGPQHVALDTKRNRLHVYQGHGDPGLL